MASITTHLPAVAQGAYSGLMRSMYLQNFVRRKPNYLCSSTEGAQAIKHLEHFVQTIAIQNGYLDLVFTPNQNLKKWAGRIILGADLLITASKLTEYWLIKKRKTKKAPEFEPINRFIDFLYKGMRIVSLANLASLIHSAVITRQTEEVTAAVMGVFYYIAITKSAKNDSLPRFPLVNKAIGYVSILIIMSRICTATKRQERLFLGACFLFNAYKYYELTQRDKFRREQK